jgi:hypothetical protein
MSDRGRDGQQSVDTTTGLEQAADFGGPDALVV